MRREIAWLLSNLNSHSAVLRSPKSPADVTLAVRAFLEGKPKHSDVVRQEPFSVYLADFARYGAAAVAKRGLWGHVSDERFQLAAASGYRSHRWWVPRVDGSVKPDPNGGSLINYRLRSIQIRQVFILFVGTVLGTCSLLLGIVLALSTSSQTPGLLALACGTMVLAGLLYFIHVAAPIAMVMTEILQHAVKQIA